MSEFLSIVHPVGRYALREQLRSIAAGFEYSTQFEHCSVIGTIFEGSSVLSRVSAEDFQQLKNVPLPFIFGRVRLDRRTDLEGTISCLPRAELSRLSDISVVRLAWAERGRNAFELISGDFGLFVVDEARRELTLVRDPFGTEELYYAQGHSGVWIANDINLLLSSSDIPLALDRRACLDFLLAGNLTFYDRRQTPFSSIRQVNSGHLYSATEAGCRSLRRWAFPDIDPEISNLGECEISERFRATLADAVGDRVRGRNVVFMLSGGLDSTSALAAGVQSSAVGRAEKLTAMTAVSGADDPEGRLASEVADTLSVPHVLHTTVRGAPFEAWTSGPFPSCNFYSAHVENLRRQAAIGDFSLNACSADYVLSPEQHTVRSVLREFGVPGGILKLSFLWWLYGYRPPMGLNLRKRMALGQGKIDRRSAPSDNYPRQWLSSGLLAEATEARRGQVIAGEPLGARHALRPQAYLALMRKDRLAMRSPLWPQDFRPIRFSDPFLDERVIRFLWSLPSLPWFHQKHILRRSFKGRLPRSVLSRPKTPARAWQDPAVTTYIRDWEPSPELDSFVDRAKLPTQFTNKTPIRDFYPLFLDFWLRESGDKIRAMRSESKKRLKTMV